MSHDERTRADLEELDDLLVRRATMGLDAEDAARLTHLLATYPDVDAEWADRAVGELDAASLSDAEAESIPVELRAALLDAAPVEPTRVVVRRTGPVAWSGWLAAAVVAALWLVPNAPAPEENAEPGWAEIVTAQGAVVASWEPGGDATGDRVSGDVVWSDDLQGGLLRLAGLAVNAPTEFQYQLWIFDESRDARYPVDGGVFDVPLGEGVVEIPVRPGVAVDAPTLFAVTVERPGGVVVSDRSRIAGLARVGEE